MLNKGNVFKLITIFLIITTFVFLLLPTEKDLRPYLYLNTQVIYAKLFYKESKNEIIVKKDIDGLKIEGRTYLNKNGTVIILIDKPKKSGFLFTNINGGDCFKLYGDMYLEGMLEETRKVCKNLE